MPMKTLIILLLTGVLICSCLVLDSSKCSLPRLRLRWKDLSIDQKKTFVKVVEMLKNTTEYPCVNATSQVDIYDTFTLTHGFQSGLFGSNTVYAHGNPGFLPWHRYYLWKFETAMQEIVTRYNNELTAKRQTKGFIDACITIPWWDWESDYKNENISSIWDSGILGACVPGCVTTGLLAYWNSSSGSCLYRVNSAARYGGLHNGPAQMMNMVAQNPSYLAFNKYLRGQPHGDPHLYIGGDPGNMGTMFSPDDVIFYLHHANVDRFWAMWQDCFDYEYVDPNAITDTIFPGSWTVSAVGQSAVYSIDSPMPYYFQSFAVSTTRLDDSPRPRDMLFIGSPTKLGFAGMYYRYGPDTFVTSFKSDPSLGSLCNFNSLVNQPIKNRRRDVSQQNSTILFNSTALVKTLIEINKKFAKHSPQQKLHYLALWECALSNRLPNRNYSTVPSNWLLMNGQSRDDWKTVCEREGWLYGYETLALMEDSEYSYGPLGASTIWIPIVVVFGVGIIIAIVVVYFLFRKNVKSLDDLTESMLPNKVEYT